MGIKLFYAGIALEILLAPIVRLPAMEVVGAVLALLGICLIWADK